ncbi:MAG TPA: hypothetical protein DCR55_03990 [Lentisphaeria bacterium]|nr:hypothetical protein [Lentisphaeria bacterium]
MQDISTLGLALAFLPVFGVIWILYVWGIGARLSCYAVLRMLTQLLLIGYVLIYVFRAQTGGIIVGVVASMIVISGWIALRTVPTKRWPLYSRAALAIAIGGGSVLVLITQVVLKLDRWYEPTFVVPLAGMIFAGSMNSVSLSAERIYSELAGGATYEDARRCALNAALIPITNSLFAVGLVSLPGMMTGQILAGVSPILAARYQIMVMCMAFAAAGLSAAVFLWLIRSLAAADKKSP